MSITIKLTGISLKISGPLGKIEMKDKIGSLNGISRRALTDIQPLEKHRERKISDTRRMVTVQWFRPIDEVWEARVEELNIIVIVNCDGMDLI